MRKFCLLSTLVLTLLLCRSVSAQDFSNRGKEFWLAYCYHVGMVNGGTPAMTLYLTSDVNTTYTVEIYGVTTLASGPIAANQVIPIPIPNAYFISTNGLTTGRAIRVTAVKPIVVYSFITRSQASAATLCLPTNVLGKEYLSSSFTQLSNENNAASYITIIAVEDNTNVEITPTAATVGGWIANNTYTVSLSKGEIYQVLGTTTGNSGVDLSGSRVKSVAGAGGCKKIAVFSGSGKISIGSPPSCNGSSADNLYQQLYPLSSWGKKFLTVPSSGRPNNHYRIYRSDPASNVYLNGALIPSGAFVNNYYQFYNNNPNLIESDKPIGVAQYFTSQNCPTPQNPYDPDMIMLNPVEQNIDKVTLVSSPLTVGQPPPHQHHIHVVMKNDQPGGTGRSSFRFDGGTVPSASWVAHPQESNYSYLYLTNVGSGNHTLRSDSGFNAIAYGYGNAETYGYSAGANVKDQYQKIGVASQYGIEPTPSVCTGSPFKFKVSLPYCADSIRWDISGLPGPPAQPPLQLYPSCVPGPGGPDSTTIVNGVTLYWYSLPVLYTINTSGSFPVTITVYKPNSDGCGNEQDIDFDLNVYDPPVADFTWIGGGCVAEPVEFNDNTVTPRPSYIWNWNFGDPASGPANISGLQNPIHTFTGPGPYTVTFNTITTPGCISATISKEVIVTPLPSGTITGATEVCINSPSPNITFTGVDGRAPYTFTYNINGGASQTISTTPGPPAGTSVTLPVPTNVAGTFRYNLTEIRNTGSTFCVQPQSSFVDIIVYPLPTATITGSTSACLNAPSPNVIFTGAGGTAPYTFTYNINGGPNQTVISTGAIATVPAPTSTAGTFTYNLVSVQDASPTACGQAQSGSVTVTVNPLPTATIDGTTGVCLNAPSPLVTFTGAGGTAPYTFTYTVNGGPNQTVVSTGSIATISVPTSTAGTFIYNLVSVQDASPTICSQAQSGSVTITVIPLPTATITGNTSVCKDAASPNVTFTGANGSPPFTFTYNINGGPNQTVTTTSGNSVNIPAPTGTAGTFIYNLVSVQEGSGQACSQPQTGSVTITVSVLPTATITGNTTVCQNAPSPSITFTGADGSAPFTFTYNINGGANQTVSTVSGNSVTVPVPTGTVGTFTYNLISVQEGSSLSCSQSQTGSVLVTVNALPTASVAGTTEVCLNAAQPNITFTGSGTTPPYTFTYNINGGALQTVSTTSGNSVTVAVPTNIAGTFVYNLLGVSDGTPQTCGQSQTGSATVIVNPLPTANFTPSVPSCEEAIITFTDNSVPNAGSIISWAWDFGDGGTSILQNPTHIYNAPGTYTVSLVVTTDKGCISTSPPQMVTIFEKPLAGYIVPEVCLSDTYAQFTDTSSITAPDNIVQWAWTFGDGGTSAIQNPQHSYTATGSYTVRLIVTTNRGCKDTVDHNIFVNGSFPVADFTVQNPATLCANDSVAIVEASTVFPGTITKVEIYWDNTGQPGVFVTDDMPFTGKVYKHLYPNFQSPLTRIFTIRYRAYSGGICVNDRIRNITVNAAPRVQFNAMPNICLDAPPYQIPPAIASEIGGVPGSGVFSGPGVSPTGLFNPAVAGPGTHTIKYKYTSTAAGCMDSLTQTIKVWEPPTADFSVSTPACERQAVTFTNNSASTEGSLTQWRWDFADGTPVVTRNNGTPFTHIFNGYGPFDVRLNVVTSNGCVSTPKVVRVNVNPLARPDFIFPDTSCLPNANVSFTNRSTIPDGTENAFSYVWDFGDPGSGTVNNSTGTNPSHTYTGTGPFNVKLQVRSGAGCVHDTTIVVRTIHPQPLASFNTDKIDVCIGGDITFTNTSNPMDGTTTQWVWDLADGTTKTVPSFTYTYAGVGTYSVTLYIVNSFKCRSTTANKTVSVNPYPPVNAGPDKFMLEGGQVMLTPTVNVNYPVFYLWNNGRYLNDSTIATPIARPPDDMFFTLRVTSDKGCSQTDIVFVKVLKKPDIPNIFSPNGDGVNDRWEIKYLESYPGCTVEVVNRYGQLVFRSVGYDKPWDGKINGTDAPVGTYYYVVSPKNGRAPITGYVDIIR